MNNQVYFIIGDVHGQYDRLLRRLKSVGLKIKNDTYQLETGKILFLGDLVDRGPDSRKVVTLAKKLTEQGIAEVILGNHEFNLLGYLTRLDKRSFFRRHTTKNNKQCKATLKSYKGHPEVLEEHLAWLKGLPLFIENAHFRAVHACWDENWIKWLKKKYPKGLESKRFFRNSFTVGKKSFFCIERLLKGPELDVPSQFDTVDSDGNIRTGVRYKWWQENNGLKLKKVATKWNSNWENIQVMPEMEKNKLSYPKETKPLFIGHYNFAGHPEFYNSNFLCLDCSDKEGNRVLIYRHELGKPLSPENIIF